MPTQMTMIPFPALMYPDRIRIHRAVWTKVQGSSIPTYPGQPEPEEIASVQSKTVQNVDPESKRLTVVTLHTVRTPADRGIKAQDRILWKGKTLVAEGPSTPKGIGDIQHKVECTESV